MAGEPTQHPVLLNWPHDGEQLNSRLLHQDCHQATWHLFCHVHTCAYVYIVAESDLPVALTQ